MEPLTMFAAAVGLISSIHLLSVTAERVGRPLAKQKTTGARTDWYCFFQTSDLTGEAASDQTIGQEILSEEEEFQQRRRQQANRPRLYA